MFTQAVGRCQKQQLLLTEKIISPCYCQFMYLLIICKFHIIITVLLIRMFLVCFHTRAEFFWTDRRRDSSSLEKWVPGSSLENQHFTPHGMQMLQNIEKKMGKKYIYRNKSLNESRK